jgi:hypothetical protein
VSTNHSVKDTIELARLQANGMDKYPEASQSAPFKAEEMRKDADELEKLLLKEESLKAELLMTTQQKTKKDEENHKKFARNVSYYAGVWGKEVSA